MDTKPLETEAMDYIRSKVARFGYKFAELNFDEDGCDFLIVKIIKKDKHYKYKCLRCQSKGRSIFPNASNIEIPKSYVGEDFLVFVYLKPEDVDSVADYMFTADDIKSRWNDKGETYYLYLDKDFIRKEKNNKFLFDKDRASIIQKLLTTVGSETNPDTVSALSDSDFYYKMWQKTGGLPPLEYLCKVSDDEYFANLLNEPKFLFLICALIIQNRDSDFQFSVDWAFEPIKGMNICGGEKDGYVGGTTYFSDVAITYRNTWVKELNTESGELAGYHLHIGDKEESVDAYIWR